MTAVITAHLSYAIQVVYEMRNREPLQVQQPSQHMLRIAGQKIMGHFYELKMTHQNTYKLLLQNVSNYKMFTLSEK
jgi:Cu2+-containing amine oxidase